ncbi:MAG: two-component system sensor histidine kinase NtrB [Brevibacillus sp.]
MKKRVAMRVTSLAPDLAAKANSLLLNHDQLSDLFKADAPHTLALLEQFIKGLANVLETGNGLMLEQQMREFALKQAKQGVPLASILEFIRLGRDVIVEQLQAEAEQLMQSPAEWPSFSSMQMDVFRYVEKLIDAVVQTCQMAEREDMRQPESALTAGEPFTEVAEQGLVQLILKSTDIAVLMIDKDLRIVEANQALADLLSVEREQIIGKQIDETFRPRECERFLQWVVERGQSGHYVAEYNGKWTTVSTSPIYHEGELQGAIAVMRNITESKRYDEELTKREALAAVGQLAAGMAHEIRNPLTSIKGFIQLLREQMETDGNQSYFSVILTEIERIDGLLNDVLVLARYRDDKIVAERFLVMEEVLGVIRLLEPESIRRGIRLELNWSGEQWHVFGYRARIKQAILNILKNALEALASKGSVVQVSAYASINQVVIIVEDDGVGLSDSVKQNLFVPFYTTKPDGTGLGLSTTQRIIIDHGGEIFADNSPQLGGARFEVRLPISMQ